MRTMVAGPSDPTDSSSFCHNFRRLHRYLLADDERASVMKASPRLCNCGPSWLRISTFRTESRLPDRGWHHSNRMAS